MMIVQPWFVRDEVIEVSGPEMPKISTLSRINELRLEEFSKSYCTHCCAQDLYPKHDPQLKACINSSIHERSNGGKL
jgi:hypothetical protein